MIGFISFVADFVEELANRYAQIQQKCVCRDPFFEFIGVGDIKRPDKNSVPERESAVRSRSPLDLYPLCSRRAI